MTARDVIAKTPIVSFSLNPHPLGDGYARAIINDLATDGYRIVGPHNFAPGQRVTKISGSSWTGRVVGFYSTKLTPVGYCVESENEPGSVQIYPETALRALPDGGVDG